MTIDVKRAMTDEAYRATLTEEEIASLPKEARGDELTDEDLASVAGGSKKLVVPRGTNG
jgi:mersacidin/lichenicidin family type 2 lantibiotic